MVFVNFCAFQRLVENKFNIKIWTFQSGRGVELDNMTMLSHFYSSSISFHKSFLEIPQQNGVAQQKHRHIIEMVSTFLLGATLPSNFWVEVTYHVFIPLKDCQPLIFKDFLIFKYFSIALLAIIFFESLVVNSFQICHLEYLTISFTIHSIVFSLGMFPTLNGISV